MTLAVSEREEVKILINKKGVRTFIFNSDEIYVPEKERNIRLEEKAKTVGKTTKDLLLENPHLRF